MPDPVLFLDPWTAATLAGGRLDPARSFCVPAPHPQVAPRALAALANSRGGELLLGAAMTPDGTMVHALGMPAEQAAQSLAAALALIDPPIDHLVRTRMVAAADGGVLVVRVRLSPSTPHLVKDTGAIPRISDDGLRPIRSRRELDELYARGRGERERADRLVDAMIEKLVLSHYAFYTLAMIACTHTPSAEPYSAAADGQLAPAADPFVAAHALHEQTPRVLPGEIELRTPGDVGAYLRVTRGGCVAVGEVQRRPYHEELGTVPDLHARVLALATTACRLLEHAPDTVMVPHLFVEGVRGLRLVLDGTARRTSSHAPQDTARYALALGDARDADYPARIAREAIEQFTSLFPLPHE